MVVLTPKRGQNRAKLLFHPGPSGELQVIRLKNVNPYDPPNAEPADTQMPIGERGRRGPSLYIVAFGLLGGFAVIPFLAMQNVLGLFAPMAGCVAGGLVYRFISQDWPHDPTVPTRQMIYSLLALTLLPATLAITVGRDGHRIPLAIIGLAVGGAVAGGIFASGSKRHRTQNSG